MISLYLTVINLLECDYIENFLLNNRAGTNKKFTVTSHKRFS